MDVSGFHHEHSVTVQSTPEDLYAIVSDVTRMGELSPVSTGGTWDDPAQAGQEGAWFTGHNAIGELTWETRCKVVVASPGREFAFVNHGPEGAAEFVRWGFRFEPDGAGTKVTQTWQVLPAYPEYVRSGDPDMDVKARIDGMAELARDGMEQTLAALKRVAEAGG